MKKNSWKEIMIMVAVVLVIEGGLGLVEGLAMAEVHKSFWLGFVGGLLIMPAMIFIAWLWLKRRNTGSSSSSGSTDPDNQSTADDGCHYIDKDGARIW